ncbi:MAG TPA: PQQ-binding-like beta-propeller repeat protein [Gemmatimonadaceae bacterium]|nr:PQQ-binding-like beta-propeller repeat protein [Gemmatimonadaceae bacterium]
MLALLGGALAACGEPGGPGSVRVRERWFEAQTGSSRAQPAAAGELVYFGTGDGQVIARERATGRPRWTTTVSLNTAVEGANLIARSGVVVAPVVTWTFGLDAATGRELWRYQPPRDVPANPANPPPGQVAATHIDADDQTVYLGAWGASVSALDLRTGAARWVWKTPDTASTRSGSMGVRLSGDTLYATVWHDVPPVGAKCEPWVVALNKHTGAELWRAVLPATSSGACVLGAAAVYQHLVIVSTLDGHLYAVDSRTQQVAWHDRREVQWAQLSLPVVVDGVLYLDGADGRLYARRPTDGAVLWSAEHAGQVGGPPTVSGQRVYISDLSQLFIFDRATGRRVTVLDPPRSDPIIFNAPPLVVDGQVFAPASNGAWSFDEP